MSKVVLTVCVVLVLLSSAQAQEQKTPASDDRTSSSGPMSSITRAPRTRTSGPTRRASCATRNCSGISPRTPDAKTACSSSRRGASVSRIPATSPAARNRRSSREYAEYTSASVTTRGLHSWKYGRFEMRGRIDTRAGLWPAFWTLGVQGRWPAQTARSTSWNTTRASSWPTSPGARNSRGRPNGTISKKPLTEFGDPDWSKKFHVWRMDWDDKSIKLYVDDLLLNSTDLKDTVNEDEEAKNPFHQPHYIILNLAIGGTSRRRPLRHGVPGAVRGGLRPRLPEAEVVAWASRP